MSHPVASRSRFTHRWIHILHEGEEVTMEDDELRRDAGKHALGDASHGRLVHYVASCGTDEPEIDLYMSPNLRGCNLNGIDEERHFLGGTFRQISILGAEYALLKLSVDDLMRDVEVAGIKALLLARGARLRHGFIETELQEKLAASEKREADLKSANKELSKQVGVLEAKIEKGKKTMEDVEECLNHNIDLQTSLRQKGTELEKLEKSRQEAEA